MKLEYFILGWLNINPCTGYDMKKLLDTQGRFGRKRAPLSQIYNTLKRMTENGWVYFEEEQRDSKPDIKIYHNTAQGEQVFLDFLCTPVEPPFRFRESDILYRVMFAFLVNPDVILEHLQTELDYRREQIAEFRPRDRTIHSENLSSEQLAYAQEIFDMLHGFGARSIDDFVLLLEEMIEYFERKKRELE
jgi:DNA-binding PadR family transcriptional regulator